MYKKSALELHQAFIDGKFTASEITARFLQRIQLLDEEVKAFLNVFAENLDESTRKKAVSKGTMDSLFDKILDSADKIKGFKDCFETLEGETELNTYGQKEVAQIYSTIRDICRIAIAYYQFDPIKRDQFNFYKVLVNL